MLQGLWSCFVSTTNNCCNPFIHQTKVTVINSVFYFEIFVHLNTESHYAGTFAPNSIYCPRLEKERLAFLLRVKQNC